LELKTGLYQNIVVRVAHFVADARRIDDSSFKVIFLLMIDLNTFDFTCTSQPSDTSAYL
jgi:hypothetical protein